VERESRFSRIGLSTRFLPTRMPFFRRRALTFRCPSLKRGLCSSTSRIASTSSSSDQRFQDLALSVERSTNFIITTQASRVFDPVFFQADIGPALESVHPTLEKHSPPPLELGRRHLNLAADFSEILTPE
jgi:hypothetical protein